MAPLLTLLLTVVWHSLVLYLFLIFGLRAVGRPIMAQNTLPEYLIVALLGSSVESALYARSGSLAAGLVSAATLLVTSRILTILLVKSSRLRRLLIGTPILLVHDGHIIRTHLRRVGLTEQDLMAAIRERGYGALDDVRFAVMEMNGSVGVVPRRAQPGQ
ncbi:MAG TPA: YetF domain-containing protein [Gemmatimonadaceae bacterium]|nr:YetF domain-containing protein [Gemmatimonadaceae bacterium]